MRHDVIQTWLIVHDCEDDDAGGNHDGDGDVDDDDVSPKTPNDNTSLIVNDCAIFPSVIVQSIQPQTAS